MLSPDCFFHNASEKHSVVWRKTGGDSETKPIHMHTHTHTDPLPSPKTLTGTSNSIYKANSSSHPQSICVSMHSLKRPWRCTHRPLLTASESSNPCRYKLSYMEVWYIPKDHLNDQMQMWDKEAPARVFLTGLAYNPLAHRKTTEGGTSSRRQSPLSLLKPAFCINEDETWPITS